MTFSFSPNTKYESPNSLIPKGTLAFATMKVQKLANSNETGGEYAKIELILQGRHENRRVFTMLCNPMDARNSEKWRQMGMGQIQHIAEAAGIFKPDVPESYKVFEGKSFIDLLRYFDGVRCAIKIGIEKGTDGHQDNNTVAEWLSPNRNSSTSKTWDKLIAGDTEPAGPANHHAQAAVNSTFANPAPAASAANIPAAPAAAAADSVPDWLK